MGIDPFLLTWSGRFSDFLIIGLLILFGTPLCFSSDESQRCYIID